MRKWTYLFHRWIGLIVSLQLLAWSLGGLLFSVMDIREVRGERYAAPKSFPHLPEGAPAIDARTAIEALRQTAYASRNTSQLALRDRGLGLRWELENERGVVACVDAQTGRLHTGISAEDARLLAEADFVPASKAKSVTLLQFEAPLEARGRRLPMYRVDMDHPSGARLYIDRVTGEVVARRNSQWRLFDFFWMLHIMDYSERESFNHPLLTAFASLAVLSASSGIVLLGWRARTPLRRLKSVSSRAREP